MEVDIKVPLKRNGGNDRPQKVNIECISRLHAEQHQSR